MRNYTIEVEGEIIDKKGFQNYGGGNVCLWLGPSPA